MKLKFKDNGKWVQERIYGVKRAYPVPFNCKGICVDIGANVGAFPIVYHEKFSQIHCFEPSYNTFNRLNKNIQKYNMQNVYSYQLAVSNTTGDIIYLKNFEGEEYSGNATTGDYPLWGNGDKEPVLTINFEDIFKIIETDKINYLKIDCEGGEYDFLMGKDLSNIDYMAIELHVQLEDKKNELKTHIEKYFSPMKIKDNGHLEIFYKNNLLK